LGSKCCNGREVSCRRRHCCACSTFDPNLLLLTRKFLIYSHHVPLKIL
jgi:hypothetical protein